MSTVLAIDPGYDRCGVALIDAEQKILVSSLCIETNKKDSHEKRLATVYCGLEKIIEQEKPVAIALETLFFSANKTSALKVAEARGVILLLAGIYEIPLFELSPQEVKLGMTGRGNAEKKEVAKMVSLTLKLDLTNKLDDEIDAIALGIAATHILHIKKIIK